MVCVCAFWIHHSPDLLQLLVDEPDRLGIAGSSVHRCVDQYGFTALCADTAAMYTSMNGPGRWSGTVTNPARDCCCCTTSPSSENKVIARHLHNDFTTDTSVCVTKKLGQVSNPVCVRGCWRPQPPTPLHRLKAGSPRQVRALLQQTPKTNSV